MVISEIILVSVSAVLLNNETGRVVLITTSLSMAVMVSSVLVIAAAGAALISPVDLIVPDTYIRSS